MKRQLFAFIVPLLLEAALVTGCAGQLAMSSLAERPTPTALSVNTRTITLADDGQTITLHVGERFLLELGEGYDWAVTVADESIVGRVAQNLYEAHQPGRTTLTARGDPLCRKVRPRCGVPSRLFRLQVVVER